MKETEFIFLKQFHEKLDLAQNTSDYESILDWVFEHKDMQNLPMYSVYQTIYYLNKQVLDSYVSKLTGDDAAYLESALIFFGNHRHFQ